MKIASEHVQTHTKYGDIEIKGVPFVDAIELSQWTGEIGQDDRNTIMLAISDVYRLANKLSEIAVDFKRYGSPSLTHPLTFDSGRKS